MYSARTVQVRWREGHVLFDVASEPVDLFVFQKFRQWPWVPMGQYNYWLAFQPEMVRR